MGENSRRKHFVDSYFDEFPRKRSTKRENFRKQRTGLQRNICYILDSAPGNILFHMDRIILFLFFFFLGCSHLKFRGNISGNETYINHKMETEFGFIYKEDIPITLKGSISRPYLYNNIPMPITTENSVEIYFW